MWNQYAKRVLYANSYLKNNRWNVMAHWPTLWLFWKGHWVDSLLYKEDEWKWSDTNDTAWSCANKIMADVRISFIRSIFIAYRTSFVFWWTTFVKLNHSSILNTSQKIEFRIITSVNTGRYEGPQVFGALITISPDSTDIHWLTD